MQSRLRALFGKRQLDSETDEAMRSHVEMRTQANIATCRSSEEAVREARKPFGSVQCIREECRDVRGASFGETLLQDVRFGARQLQRNPGFTVVAVLRLALGIGISTEMFTAIQAV